MHRHKRILTGNCGQIDISLVSNLYVSLRHFSRPIAVDTKAQETPYFLTRIQVSMSCCYGIRRHFNIKVYVIFYDVKVSGKSPPCAPVIGFLRRKKELTSAVTNLKCQSMVWGSLRLTYKIFKIANSVFVSYLYTLSCIFELWPKQVINVTQKSRHEFKFYSMAHQILVHDLQGREEERRKEPTSRSSHSLPKSSATDFSIGKCLGRQISKGSRFLNNNRRKNERNSEKEKKKTR